MTVDDDPLDAAPWTLSPYDVVSMGRIVDALLALAEEPPVVDPAQPLPPKAVAARDAVLEAARRYCGAIEQACLDRRIRAPETWRDTLHRLRADPRRFAALVRDRDARAVLRFAAAQLGLLEATGTHWLHHLRDSPADLRRTIDRALGRNKWLRNPGGRPSHYHLTRFVADLAPVYQSLTGGPLRRSVTSATKAEGRQPGVAAGPGVRFVRLCIEPLEPDITDETIAQLIRTSWSEDFQSKRILRLTE